MFWRKLFVFLTLMSFLGCETATPVTEIATTKQVRLQLASADAEPAFILPDDTKGVGWENYATAVKTYIKQHPNTPLELVFEPLPIPTTDGQIKAPLYQKIPFMDYGVSFNAYTNKYVNAPCFKASGPAVNLRLTKASKGDGLPYVDLHIVVYKMSGKPCVGIYDSGKWSKPPFCTKFCGPSYSSIKNAIYSAAIAAGVGTTLASLMAAAGAPLAVGALAL